MRFAKLALLLILLLVLLRTTISVGNPACSGHLRHDKEISLNGRKLYIQEVVSPDEQRQGLGNLSCIAKNEAMLFIFDRPDYYKFWMKDTRFALDIVWLDSNHKVVTDLQGVQPSSYPTTFVSNVPAQYVLELPAGQASFVGIRDGQQVQF